jgi:hypothetical protein
METYQDMTDELKRPIGGALTGMEWFILFTFIEQSIQRDETFATIDDAKAMQLIATRLHDQIFPPKRDNLEEFADVVMLKPKKLITKPDIIL